MCRQYKDILTELLDKRLSPGRGQVDSCVRRNVLTFFLSEVFSQAWPESIITQVKGSLVLNLWLLSSQKEFYLQLPQKPSWYTLIFWYIIVWRRTSTKVKEFFFLQMYFNIQLLYQRGLPWQSSGYNSPLPLQGAQVQSLVREPRSRILLLLSRFSRVRLCVTPETAAHWAPLSLRFSRQEHWSGLPFPSRMHESEKWKVKVKSLSHVRLLATPWTAAFQAPPSMGFFRQEYWSGVPLPSLKIPHKVRPKKNK